MEENAFAYLICVTRNGKGRENRVMLPKIQVKQLLGLEKFDQILEELEGEKARKEYVDDYVGAFLRN